jgi:transcription initiation factor TFIID TATA-box-binding protein
LDCRLDLKLVALHAKIAVEYNPTKRNAAVMRIKNPSSTAIVFASGKMIITGAKSEQLARRASLLYARAVQKVGYRVRFVGFKTHNFVGSASCGFHIRLEGIEHAYMHSAKYEPELWPGLLFSMAEPQVRCNVFSTGKVMIMGAKTEDEVNEAFANLYPILLGFRIGNNAPAVAQEQEGVAERVQEHTE